MMDLPEICGCGCGGCCATLAANCASAWTLPATRMLDEINSRESANNSDDLDFVFGLAMRQVLLMKVVLWE